MAIASAAAMTACSREIHVETDNYPHECILSATAGSDTRIGFDKNADFYWSKGDKIGVTSSFSPNSFSPLTILDGQHGQARASFSGTISGNLEGYAVYPYKARAHSMNGSVLTYSLPSSYEYKGKVDQSFFTEVQGEGYSFNPMMWGKIENGAVNFKHLGGVFCINVESMPLESGVLKVLSDKKITGKYTVDLSAETPVINAVAADSDWSEVNIKFSGATKNAPGVFYVPAPVGTHDVWVDIYTTDDTDFADPVASVNFANTVLNRTKSKILKLSAANLEGGQMSLANWNTGEDEGGAAE